MKKPEKSKSDSSRKAAISADIYETLIRNERRRAFVSSYLINFSLTYYFLAGVYYLYTRALEIESMSFSILAVQGFISLIFGYFWTRSPRSAGRSMVERTNSVLKGLREESRRNWFKTFSGIFSMSILVMTMILGWNITDMSLQSLLSAQGLAGAQRIFEALFSPNLEILGPVLNAMIETIFIAFMATLIAIPVAFAGSFFCARNLMRGSGGRMTVYNSLRVVFNFTRSVEPLIWAIVFSVWVGIGPYAGMLALMIHSVAALAKLYSEQIESIDKGPIEAIEATGANRVQTVWYAVVPQIVLPYLSFTIYRWDINIRMATIIGLVGGGGVGTLLMQYQGLARWNEVGTIVIVIAIVVWVMDYLSAKIREAIY